MIPATTMMAASIMWPVTMIAILRTPGGSSVFCGNECIACMLPAIFSPCNNLPAQSTTGFRRLSVNAVRFTEAGRLRMIEKTAGRFNTAGLFPRDRTGPFAAGRLPQTNPRAEDARARCATTAVLVRARSACNGNTALANRSTPCRRSVSHHGRHSASENVNLDALNPWGFHSSSTTHNMPPNSSPNHSHAIAMRSRAKPKLIHYNALCTTSKTYICLRERPMGSSS